MALTLDQLNSASLDEATALLGGACEASLKTLALPRAKAAGSFGRKTGLSG